MSWLEEIFINNLWIVVVVGLGVTLVFFAVFIACLLVGFVKRKTKRKYIGKSFDSKLVFFTIGLMVSMFVLQYLSECYAAGVKVGEVPSVFEVLVSSFLHTLKSFGADDNFLTGMSDFRKLILLAFSAEWTKSVTVIYNAIAIIMAVSAPLTSATIIFEVLTNFFPKLRLYCLRKISKRELYFFSELNERSLKLAESIKEAAPDFPEIIFTNVNKSRGALIGYYCKEAKRIGAICLSEDITLIKKDCSGETKLFLINDDEIENLQILTELADEFDKNSKNSTEIYLFCQDYAYIDIEKQFRAKFNENCAPVVIPVRHYRNLITNMLETTPLYEPIVHKQKEDRILNVTILGIGDIGTEMFLNTYWIGQMLDCKLRINVVSKEPVGAFENKLDYINPEILKTTKEDDAILKIYKDKGVCAKPYCEYNYFSCDIKSTKFKSLLNEEIANTHYFLVSLGSDEENLSVANMLKTEIGRLHIGDKSKGKQVEKTVINYVVYNSSLNKTLGEGNLICSYSNDEPDMYMQAVGGIKNIYSAENIFMKNHIADAENSAERYDKKRGEELRKNGYEERLKDEYAYWSNLAVSLHFKYKIFSVDLITKSIFDKGYKKDDVQYYRNEYIKTFKTERANPNEANSPTVIEQKLQWLEHRRWNAFLRTMGFCGTDNYNVYKMKTKSPKNMEMKLHPCLVECLIPVCGKCNKKRCSDCEEVYKATEKDLLDELSVEFDSDYKGYDFSTANILTKK